jgi:hypothetical protein
MSAVQKKLESAGWNVLLTEKLNDSIYLVVAQRP